MGLLHDRVRLQRSFDIHGDGIGCKTADQNAILLHLPAAVANPDRSKIDQHGIARRRDPAAAKGLDCDPGAGADPNTSGDQHQDTAAYQPIGCLHPLRQVAHGWHYTLQRG